MQRFSRALDTVWVISAFDPRKPVDPDWARKPPKAILRSGDERDIFDGGPHEHHQGEDSMQWSPESHGAEEPNLIDLDFHGGGLGDYYPSQPGRPEMPDHDVSAIGQYSRAIRGSGIRLDGSEGHYVEYHPTSSVNHYYTYNPRSQDDWEPWNLVSTHWRLREPIQTRHQTFSDAVGQSVTNRSIIDRQVG